MPLTEEQLSKNWWADGDTPVRDDSRVTYLVDGRTTMLTMCRHFIKAQHYIYLACWGLTASFQLVRGTDSLVGPAGSPEQEAHLAELRAEGFQEADIEFWCNNDLTVQSVLGYAVSKGVEVKVLLWKCPELFSHYSPQAAHDHLTAVGVTCFLDDSTLDGLRHPAEALHQKIAIVDGTHAFVGGIDPLVENEGDFDRWDTHGHFLLTPLRHTSESTPPHPWHDVHAIIEGPAAGDVELNFRQRWNDVAQRHDKNSLIIPQHPLPPSLESNILVQVARTIPEHTYKFKPSVVRGIAQLYANALSNAQQFIYLENQYFWLRAYLGIDVPFIGIDNHEMEQNLHELGAALQRGASLAIVLPDHPNVGRAFTDEGLAHLRAKAPQAVEEGRLQVFCLATSTKERGHEHYRPIYVHSKVAIVDDIWVTVGSANLNNRGMRDDTEMNVASLDTELAYGLRLLLQGEHLGLIQDGDLFAMARLLGRQIQSVEEKERGQRIQQELQEMLDDPFIAMRMMHERAWENLKRYKANQPLVGHLLPYLTAAEATQQGLNCHHDHGWLEEPLP